MRFIILMGLLLCVSVTSFADINTPKETDLQTMDLNMGDVSYALGVYMGQRFLNDDGLKVDQVVQGLKDSRQKGKARMTPEQVQTLVISYGIQQQMKQQQEAEVEKDKNVQAGNAFRENYKKDPRTVEHASGLLYRVLAEGEGNQPAVQDTVLVRYILKNIEGDVIQEIPADQDPIPLQIANTIQGWQIAIPEMKTGGVWELVVPPDLGYGDRRVSPEIGPGQTLLFNVQLVEIEE